MTDPKTMEPIKDLLGFEDKIAKVHLRRLFIEIWRRIGQRLEVITEDEGNFVCTITFIDWDQDAAGPNASNGSERQSSAGYVDTHRSAQDMLNSPMLLEFDEGILLRSKNKSAVSGLLWSALSGWSRDGINYPATCKEAPGSACKCLRSRRGD
jgi:hypothetical protein